MPRTLSDKEKEEYREKLCEAARRLFAARGIDGVTMRALATEIGVSPMQPYHHFKDKNEILAEVLTRTFNRFVDVLDAADQTPGTAFDRAKAKRVAYVRFALAEPDSYRLMFSLPHPKETDYPGMSDAMNRTRASMRRSLEELIAEHFVQGDPDFLGYAFWISFHGPVSLYLAGKLPPDMSFEDLININLQGLFMVTAPPR
jgi:AcrR family transcriptional regulator